MLAGGTGSASVCLPKRGLRPNSIDTIKPARASSSRLSRSEYNAGEVVFFNHDPRRDETARRKLTITCAVLLGN